MMAQKYVSSLPLFGIVALTLASIPALSAHALDNMSNTGSNLCYYEGKSYSPGAKITLPNGTVQTCQKDGTWARQAPTTSPWSNIKPSGVLAK